MGISPAARLRRLTNGYQITQAIHVAAVLGLADELAGGPLDAATLAARTGTHPDALRRLLRALAAVDVVEERPDGTYANAELGEALRRDADPPVAEWAAFVGRPAHWAAWAGLQHSVRTGENAFRAVHGQSAWEYRADHPEEGAVFDGAMTGVSRYALPSILDAYDFRRFPVIADIGGGGRATVLSAILERHPGGRGILFDQPHVVAKASVPDRVEVVGGSFFDRVPGGADAYVIKSVLHDWEAADCVRILRVVRRDMPAHARLIVIERLLGTDGFAVEVALSDLNMLTGPGGAERTEADFAEILVEAGFAPAPAVRTATEFSVIEASTAGSPV